MASKGLVGSSHKGITRIASIFFFLINLAGVTAFPGGAPNSDCESMRPGHGSESGATPYTLTILNNVVNYTAASTIQVQITGQSFAGVLLQARRKESDDTTPVGTFTAVPPETKLKRCSNDDDSVTHSSTVDKISGTTFTWQAPSMDVGEIEFVGCSWKELLSQTSVLADFGERATVAQARSTWWLNHRSTGLMPNGFDTMMPSGGTDTTDTPSGSTGPSYSQTAGFFFMLVWLLKTLF